MPFKVEFDERILSESAIKENLLEWDNDLSVDYNSKRKSTNYDKKFGTKDSLKIFLLVLI